MKKYLFALFLPLFIFAVPAPPGRPPSAPFISGDTFRFFADHAYDEIDTSLDPRTIKKGDTVFVKTDYLNPFFKKIHPEIKHRYILISHNSDDPAPGPYTKFLQDNHLIAWFAQNYDGYPHPKMHPIPIGIANAHWQHGDFHKIAKVQKKQLSKSHLVYLNILTQTFFEERKKVTELFSKSPYCYAQEKRPYNQFLQDVASSIFTLSPRGNGLDTHRLWEALYLGSIPIVKTSSLDSLYNQLPVLIISDWEEISEEFLKNKLLQFKCNEALSKQLFIQYWLDLIDSKR